MNARDLEVLNRRNRMTQAERDEDVVREVFGPTFAAFFGIPNPIKPTADLPPIVLPVDQATGD